VNREEVPRLMRMCCTNDHHGFTNQHMILGIHNHKNKSQVQQNNGVIENIRPYIDLLYASECFGCHATIRSQSNKQNVLVLLFQISVIFFGFQLLIVDITITRPTLGTDTVTMHETSFEVNLPSA